MLKDLEKSILIKIQKIIYDRETSVAEKTKTIFNFLDKYENELDFWDRENLLDTDILESIIFEYPTPQATPDDEKVTKDPFYRAVKSIAAAEYKKIINEKVEDFFKEKEKQVDPFEAAAKAFKNLTDSINEDLKQKAATKASNDFADAIGYALHDFKPNKMGGFTGEIFIGLDPAEKPKKKSFFSKIFSK